MPYRARSLVLAIALACVLLCALRYTLSATSSSQVYSRPVRSAFVIVTHVAQLPRLKCSMPNMRKNLFKQFPAYPLLVYHEGFTADDLALLQSLIGFETEVKFFQIVFPRTSTISFNSSVEICNRFTTGYRFMCQFHAKDIYDRPEIAAYDYIWRLDDDSKYKAVVPDIPRIMQNQGFKYAYNKVQTDVCVENLVSFHNEYAQLHNLESSRQNTTGPINIYYNNFEVISTQFALSASYQAYMSALATSGGIFKYRWGDAPIKTLAVEMLLAPDQVFEVKDNFYEHSVHYYRGQCDIWTELKHSIRTFLGV
eukprot:TRINITY_DN4636_c0_g1_i1.p1 TRINITY_DN4636_c0_g1~~TRINITY_DN4636_c0_g1_i1.p1  ORF type:complete len:310 (+),score=16.97 TRINITY_DN4636_c0_g1_i1:122-1051(+)